MKWKTFKKDDNLFMLKLEDAKVIQIYLTDLQCLFTETLDIESLSSRFKENNPNVEADFETVQSQLTQIVDDLNDGNIILSSEGNRVDLTLETEFECVTGGLKPQKLEYKFSLTKTENSEFTKLVTVPMMQTVNLLERQRHMLTSMLELKDKALEWYKMEKGAISRDDLNTEKFDPVLLKVDDEKLLVDVFKSESQFWNGLVENYGQVKVDVLEVQVNPWNAKRRKRVYNSKTVQKMGSGISFNKSKK